MCHFQLKGAPLEGFLMIVDKICLLKSTGYRNDVKGRVHHNCLVCKIVGTNLGVAGASDGQSEGAGTIGGVKMGHGSKKIAMCATAHK